MMDNADWEDSWEDNQEDIDQEYTDCAVDWEDDWEAPCVCNEFSSIHEGGYDYAGWLDVDRDDACDGDYDGDYADDNYDGDDYDGDDWGLFL
jgi:hypothetical protein